MEEIPDAALGLFLNQFRSFYKPPLLCSKFTTRVRPEFNVQPLSQCATPASTNPRGLARWVHAFSSHLFRTTSPLPNTVLHAFFTFLIQDK